MVFQSAGSGDWQHDFTGSVNYCAADFVSARPLVLKEAASKRTQQFKAAQPDRPRRNSPAGETMTFTDSIQSCFKKYAEFNGRASRSEYWWWALFVLVTNIGARMIGDIPGAVVALGTLLPYLAVTSRRLHDIDRSGWWQLVSLIPLIGWAVVIYWYVQDSTAENKYG